ncbi:hypothetical protein [Pseudomonas sp. UBA6310]|uniref:hypothetical protein n=1 Tax=Pseudomonas sp. UBA6310 TaxID=1947327 RepID=UPI0039C9050F
MSLSFWLSNPAQSINLLALFFAVAGSWVLIARSCVVRCGVRSPPWKGPSLGARGWTASSTASAAPAWAWRWWFPGKAHGCNTDSANQGEGDRGRLFHASRRR